MREEVRSRETVIELMILSPEIRFAVSKLGRKAQLSSTCTPQGRMCLPIQLALDCTLPSPRPHFYVALVL